MAFSFGGSSAPAPSGGAGGGFSFASSNPAPTPAFGSSTAPGPSTTQAPAPFSFGSSTPALATGSTGFGFGGSSAPAPVPGSTGFGFGGSSAPAPSTGLFGQPSPGPLTGFGFGSPSPAPAFGAPTPGAFGAPAPGAFGASNTGAFGSSNTGGAFSFSSPAPAAFGTAFGAPAPTTMQPPQPPVSISGSMPYSSLTPEMKQNIDMLHEIIMQHKRTVIRLQSIGPSQLQTSSETKKAHLQHQREKLQSNIQSLKNDLERMRVSVAQQKSITEKVLSQAIMFAKWPVEALAQNRGVRLPPEVSASSASSQEEKKSDIEDTQTRIREAVERGLASVDRIDRMPSPYYWEVLQDLEQRTSALMKQTQTLHNQLELSRQMTLYSQDAASGINEILETQHAALANFIEKYKQLHAMTESVRFRYRMYERGENVLEKAALSDAEYERRINEKVELAFLKATSDQAPQQQSSTFASNTPGAPAPGSTGFSFASPAPSGLGVTPAPSTGLFSSSTTSTNTTPAPAAFSFASTSSTATTTTNKKKSSRSSGRLKGK